MVNKTRLATTPRTAVPSAAQRPHPTAPKLVAPAQSTTATRAPASAPTTTLPRTHAGDRSAPSRQHDVAVAAVILGAQAVGMVIGAPTAEAALPRSSIATRLADLEARKADLSPTELAAERRALYSAYVDATSGQPTAVADPAPRAEHSSATLKRLSGVLWSGTAPEVTDVVQGVIGDCFLAAAVASTAHVQPEVLQRMVEDHGNGTYTVTFKAKNTSGKFEDKEVTVDADLYTRGGRLLYGASTDGGKGTQELLWPIIEKAYAAWKGEGYGKLDGGSPREAMEAIWGREAVSRFVSKDKLSEVWENMRASLAARLPVTAGSSFDPELQKQTGVVDGHAHTVLRAFERDGVRYVTVREPYGRFEPKGDGVKDGTFTLSMDAFAASFDVYFRVVP